MGEVWAFTAERELGGSGLVTAGVLLRLGISESDAWHRVSAARGLRVRYVCGPPIPRMVTGQLAFSNPTLISLNSLQSALIAKLLQGPRTHECESVVAS
jgi:hypothetical protein